MEPYSVATSTASWKKGTLQQRGLVHQAVRLMLDAVNSPDRNDIPWLEIPGFHFGHRWPKTFWSSALSGTAH